ncbi:7779_t:CDS:2 [Diversispora eburnea]|uniref:7779_t:CDS:1 n=1 Tax=Diversispora eburnea TaxID=1213867 RepID=A0A9N8YPC6_9GLOM|nr:7779_t:CDS:2 [Diversispora eburnea]
MQDRNSFCSVSSPIRYSYPRTINTVVVVNRKSVTIDLKKKLGSHTRRISNDSISSNDSGIGLPKEEYEIRRAVKAQRVSSVQRPHIILMHKGKPVNNQNNEDADSNLILKAAIASKRHRREIAVMQQRNSFYNEERDIISHTKQESNPIIVDLNGNVDVSKVDDNSTINVSKDVTQESEINSDIKPAVSEEFSKDNIVSLEEPIINCTLIESKMDIIPEEPKESNEQILKTNKENIPIHRIRSPRRNSIFINNYSPMKKISKSVKKFLERRNVTVACLNCRQRKAKCSGEYVCERCKTYELERKFTPVAKRSPQNYNRKLRFKPPKTIIEDNLTLNINNNSLMTP